MTDVEVKKQWLKRYRHIQEKINRLNNKINTIDDKITNIHSPNYSYTPKARSSNPKGIDDYLSDKNDTEERIKRLKDKGSVYRREILDCIDTLNDVRQAEVLEMFCIDCMSISDIADTMGYTERWIAYILAAGVGNAIISV